MQGQTDVDNLYRLEQQFQYSDSIRIIRKQVEKYEDLVKEQAERMERARRNSEKLERLLKEAETLKEGKWDFVHLLNLIDLDLFFQQK